MTLHLWIRDSLSACLNLVQGAPVTALWGGWGQRDWWGEVGGASPAARRGLDWGSLPVVLRMGAWNAEITARRGANPPGTAERRRREAARVGAGGMRGGSAPARRHGEAGEHDGEPDDEVPVLDARNRV